MKRFSLFLLLLLLLIIVVPPVSRAALARANSMGALTDSVNTTGAIISPRVNLTPASAKLTQAAEKLAQTQSGRLEKLRTRTTMEIDRRLKSLFGLTERINNIKRLTAEQKSSLTSSIQEQIASLTSLKTKIQADSDLETLKADAKSIIDSYRIYLLYLPKIHILTVADVELNYADKLTELSGKLETRLQEEKTAGKDISQLESLLTQIQNKITEGKSKAQSAFDAVLNLKPEDYPGNKTNLEAARTSLQSAKQNLQEARRLASQIIAGVKGLKKGVTPIVTSVVTP